ncbi:MAG TPA: four helix bundle protein [Bacteroidales bacterium]|jgi:four helix bundle protein|nr:four helix bundle protein [Bacteroidales bacterium]
MDAKEMIKRTKQFGYDCIELSDSLYGNYLKNHVRGQLIRCSTSVGANYRAARLAQSKASFVAKVSISVEEADESAMWLEMIIDKRLLHPKYDEESKRLIREANELTSIFVATRKTIETKRNI